MKTQILRHLFFLPRSRHFFNWVIFDFFLVINRCCLNVISFSFLNKTNLQNIVESMHMGYIYLIVFWSKNGWTDLAQVELLLEKELRTMEYIDSLLRQILNLNPFILLIWCCGLIFRAIVTLFDLPDFTVWYIYGLWYWVAKIKGLEK